MGFAWRVLVVLSVFIGVGVAVSHVVMVEEMAKATAPIAEIRLASWMSGLFAGGLAAVLVAVALLLKRRR
jgi:hypothetical protein